MLERDQKIVLGKNTIMLIDMPIYSTMVSKKCLKVWKNIGHIQPIMSGVFHSHTVKTKVCMAHQMYSIHTPNTKLVCVQSIFGVPYTLLFLQCNEW